MSVNCTGQQNSTFCPAKFNRWTQHYFYAELSYVYRIFLSGRFQRYRGI